MKWLMVLALLPLPAPAQPVIEAENPRRHGWWLGDELVQRLHVPLPEGVTIESASLPRPRAVDYWLDLREVTTERTENGVDVMLRWQNFYAAMEPKLREVPPSPIRLSDGTETTLPGFEFVTSPIHPIMMRPGPDEMMPDPAYHLIDTRPNRIGLALMVLVFVLTLMVLAWHQAWWPFHARPARPFTRAARQMGRANDAGARRRLLHRAFDAAFGRVLIGADLPRFLAARPEFRPLEDRLAAFFHDSDAAFFGAGQPGAAGEVPTLARDLSRIERGQR